MIDPGKVPEQGGSLMLDQATDLPFDWFAAEVIPDEGESETGAPFWAWRGAQPTRTPEFVITRARTADPRWAVPPAFYVPASGTKVPYESPSDRDRLIAYRLRVGGLATVCADCGGSVLRAWDWRRQTLRLVEEVRNTGKFLLREGLLTYWGPTGGPIRTHRCRSAQTDLFGGRQ
jgi:hypothetical protein